MELRYCFDDFVFDPNGGLTRGGAEVELAPRAHDLLRYFIKNPGRIISRDELCDRLWDGKIVSDAAISTQIRSIRKALGDDREQMRFLRTHPRRGFSFIADVAVYPSEADERSPGPAAPGNQAHPDIGASPPPTAYRGRMAWIVGLVLLAVIGVLGYWVNLGATQTDVSRPRGPSIAVLPFDNLSDDPNLDYLADAFTEELITDLSRIRDAFVISRSTSFTYRGKNIGAPQIAADLDVRYVLEGSIRVDDGEVRINAQLIDGENDSHLWAQRYDRSLDGLFDIQGNVTGQIASVLRAELRMLDNDRQEPEMTNDAWDHALRGNVLLYNRKSVSDFQDAYAHLTKAVDMDPGISSASVSRVPQISSPSWNVAMARCPLRSSSKARRASKWRLPR